MSHSHLNCTFRNVTAGKKGCACGREPTVVGEAFTFKCKCGNAVICDDNGFYDMQWWLKHDEDWEVLARRGLKWQVLSWKMEKENPKAVSIISISLNKKKNLQ